MTAAFSNERFSSISIRPTITPHPSLADRFSQRRKPGEMRQNCEFDMSHPMPPDWRHAQKPRPKKSSRDDE